MTKFESKFAKSKPIDYHTIYTVSTIDEIGDMMIKGLVPKFCAMPITIDGKSYIRVPKWLKGDIQLGIQLSTMGKKYSIFRGWHNEEEKE